MATWLLIFLLQIILIVNPSLLLAEEKTYIAVFDSVTEASSLEETKDQKASTLEKLASFSPKIKSEGQGFFVFSSSGLSAQQIADLQAEGIFIEEDQMIALQTLPGNGQVYDPEALPHFYTPTFLARHPNSNYTVAHDYTTGSSGVSIGLADVGRTEAEVLWDIPRSDNSIPYTNNTLTDNHGSKTSYVAHARKDGVGSVGVCPDCRRLYLELGQSDSGDINLPTYLSDILAKLDRFIMSPVKPDVLSFSWGIPFFSRALDQILRRAKMAGINIVAAAGNNAGLESLYPASADYVIGAGATGFIMPDDSLDPLRVATFSNSGADLAAPGVRIAVPSSSRTSTFESLEGTSFATPHIASAIALMKSYIFENHQSFGHFYSNPNLKRRAEYLEQILKITATDIETPGHDARSGDGLINIKAAIEKLIADARDYGAQLIRNLNRGISEWGSRRLILDLAKQRIESSNPSTNLILEIGPTTIRIPNIFLILCEISRPRLTFSIGNPTFNYGGLDNNNLFTEISGDLNIGGYARIGVTAAGFPLFELTANFSLVPEPGTNSRLNVWLEHKLEPEGYQVVSTRFSYPRFTDVRLSIDGLPAIIDQLLPRVKEKLTPELLDFVAEYAPSPAAKHFMNLSEKLVENALAVERSRPYPYFEFRTAASASSWPGVDFFGSHLISHALSGSSESKLKILAPRPAALSQNDFPGLTADSIDLPLNAHDAQVTSHKTLFTGQLAHMMGIGAFDFNSDPNLIGAYTVGTAEQPGGVDFALLNFELTRLPEINFLPGANSPNLNQMEIKFYLRGTVGVGTQSTTNYMTYIVPTVVKSIYKSHETETNGLLEPASFDIRVVPDSTRTRISSVFQNPNFLPGVATLATEYDINQLFHHTLGQKILRNVSGLSSGSFSLNSNLGSHWGCMSQFAGLINWLYQQQEGNEGKNILTVRSEANCINLDLGLYKPDASRPTVNAANNQASEGVMFYLRQSAKEPRAAQLQPVARIDQFIKNGVTYYGGEVTVNFVPGTTTTDSYEPAQEIQVGTPYYRDSFLTSAGHIKSRVRVKMVENIWQLGSSSRELLYMLVPMPFGHTSTSAKIVGIGRNAAQLNIQSNCLPQVEAFFSRGIRPTISDQQYAQNYIELPVGEDENRWSRETGPCVDPGGEPENTRPPYLDPTH